MQIPGIEAESCFLHNTLNSLDLSCSWLRHINIFIFPDMILYLDWVQLVTHYYFHIPRYDIIFGLGSISDHDDLTFHLCVRGYENRLKY